MQADTGSIKQLKARHIGFLDSRLWGAWAELLTGAWMARGRSAASS
jgi:hypothetical protein